MSSTMQNAITIESADEQLSLADTAILSGFVEDTRVVTVTVDTRPDLQLPDLSTPRLSRDWPSFGDLSVCDPASFMEA
jgi:hypothetical protein